MLVGSGRSFAVLVHVMHLDLIRKPTSLWFTVLGRSQKSNLFSQEPNRCGLPKRAAYLDLDQRFHSVSAFMQSRTNSSAL